MTNVGASIPERFVHLDAARARFGDRVDRLAPMLLQVDPLADAVVEWFERVPPGAGWESFVAMLEGRDTSLARHEMDAPLRSLFRHVERVPLWVDWTTLDRGGELLMRAGVFGGIVLGSKSLVHGYSSPGGNKPLVFSGRLREQAARRLNETSRFVQAVCRRGGLRRGADGFAITLKVRVMHAQVRRMILRSGRWDERVWGAPINQHDMAATTLLFSLAVLDGLRAFGFRISSEESESFMQLWRYAGWLLGVDPEILPTSEHEARRLAELVRATQGPPDDDSRALVRALLDSPLDDARTEAQRRAGRLQRSLGQAFCRFLVGPDEADALDVPETPWRHVVRGFRAAAVASEYARALVPSAHRAAVAAGERYWDRVVAVGLAGATAEFRPPERLAVPT